MNIGLGWMISVALVSVVGSMFFWVSYEKNKIAQKLEVSEKQNAVYLSEIEDAVSINLDNAVQLERVINDRRLADEAADRLFRLNQGLNDENAKLQGRLKDVLENDKNAKDWANTDIPEPIAELFNDTEVEEGDDSKAEDNEP